MIIDFLHVFTSNSSGNRVKLAGDFRSTINPFGSIISSPDLILYSVLELLRSRGFVTKESMEAAASRIG